VQIRLGSTQGPRPSLLIAIASADVDRLQNCDSLFSIRIIRLWTKPPNCPCKLQSPTRFEDPRGPSTWLPASLVEGRCLCSSIVFDLPRLTFLHARLSATSLTGHSHRTTKLERHVRSHNPNVTAPHVSPSIYEGLVHHLL